MANIVVIGAGVSGLTSALLLSKVNENSITVVAKHMPGDYEAEYTSPWAGANMLPMASAELSCWERRTWPELQRLAKEVPAAGIHIQKAQIYRRKAEKEGRKNALVEHLFEESPWFKDLMPDYRELDPSELPADVESGCEFTSVCINTALYLPWLVSQCLASGVVLKRANLQHIADAANLHHSGKKADIVVNCSGLLSCRLGGVMDSAVMPARGQIVLVRNEANGVMRVSSGTDDGGDELFYVMERAGGGGTVLGGTYQLGNWNSVPDPNIATRIMNRAVKTYPELTGGKGVEALDIIRHGVGFRPFREGGVRLERDVIRGVPVVHNYGHAGWGYQGSYGCAERVLELVAETLAQKRTDAKL